MTILRPMAVETAAMPDSRKINSVCSSCKRVGHWKGDAVCENVRNGSDNPHDALFRCSGAVDMTASEKEGTIRATCLIREVLQARAESGDELAVKLVSMWTEIVADLPDAVGLTVLPGIIRGSATAALTRHSIARSMRQQYAVLLDDVLWQVAKAMPKMVSRKSGTLGGAQIAPNTSTSGCAASGKTPAHEVPCLQGRRGVLITTTPQKGRMNQAAKEFVALVSSHSPSWCMEEVPGANSPLMLLEEQTGVDDVIPALESLYGSMLGTGHGFEYCERILPLQIICEDALDPVKAAVMQLTSSLLGVDCNSTSFAIRAEGGVLHSVPGGLKSRLSAVAEAIPDFHKVDLKSPSVSIYLRGFDVYGKRFCGVSVCLGALPTCPRSSKDFSLASSTEPYYREDINSPQGATTPSDDTSESKALPSRDQYDCWYERLQTAIQQADRDNSWFKNVAECTQSWSEVAKDSRKASVRRKQMSNEVQVPALVDAFASGGLLSSATATVEFGAGRGTLTQLFRRRQQDLSASSCSQAGVDLSGEVNSPAQTEHKAEAVSPAAGSACLSLLVDRDSKLPSWRHKGDRWVEDDLHHLRIDIRHLWLPGIAELSGRRVAGIGKHVCGAATDLALRCICEASRVAREPEDGQSVGLEVAGVGIALCCHHVCTWADYVDQEWVTDSGFSPQEFGVIARMSAWAHQKEERQQKIGLACKRFLDAGRVRFLRRRGFQAVVQDYVAAEYTKENRMLFAMKLESSSDGVRIE